MEALEENKNNANFLEGKYILRHFKYQVRLEVRWYFLIEIQERP